MLMYLYSYWTQPANTKGQETAPLQHQAEPQVRATPAQSSQFTLKQPLRETRFFTVTFDEYL